MYWCPWCNLLIPKKNRVSIVFLNFFPIIYNNVLKSLSLKISFSHKTYWEGVAFCQDWMEGGLLLFSRSTSRKFQIQMNVNKKLGWRQLLRFDIDLLRTFSLRKLLVTLDDCDFMYYYICLPNKKKYVTALHICCLTSKYFKFLITQVFFLKLQLKERWSVGAIAWRIW